MASARLQITVERACNLYNSDGVLAGKSDPYVIVEVPGQENLKLQTQVISNELNPVWNETCEIAGFMDGDVLRFTVMDKDTFPKPDDFLGKAELTAQDFYPNGFHGELMLADSKTQATLSVMVDVTGCDEVVTELVEGEGVQMMVSGELVEGTTVEGSSCAEVLASGVIMQGLQVYSPGILTTTTATNHSMTYTAPQTDSAPHTDSAPQTDSAPEVPMNGIVTTNIVESQSMASQPVTYEAPEAPVPSESVADTGEVVEHPLVIVTAEESALQPDSEPQTGQPMTYEAPQAPVPSESFTAVIVHPPVTVTAEEFAKIMNGGILSELTPVTAGTETVGVGTKREVDVNDTEAMDKTVKIKKKKSKRCC